MPILFRLWGGQYAFLDACAHYASKGVELEADEVFISDGAKSDLGNIPDVFAVENTVLVPDPVYPVYLDTNVMAGRSIIFSKGSIENGFLPLPEPGLHADLVYLCSPNNPTGAVYTKEQLKAWVDWALDHDAVIIFDSAYEAFVQDQELPTSIYQIEGAKSCAIEFCPVQNRGFYRHPLRLHSGAPGVGAGSRFCKQALAGGSDHEV